MKHIKFKHLAINNMHKKSYNVVILQKKFEQRVSFNKIYYTLKSSLHT